MSEMDEAPPEAEAVDCPVCGVQHPKHVFKIELEVDPFEITILNEFVALMTDIAQLAAVKVVLDGVYTAAEVPGFIKGMEQATERLSTELITQIESGLAINQLERHLKSQS